MRREVSKRANSGQPSQRIFWRGQILLGSVAILAVTTIVCFAQKPKGERQPAGKSLAKNATESDVNTLLKKAEKIRNEHRGTGRVIIDKCRGHGGPAWQFAADDICPRGIGNAVPLSNLLDHCRSHRPTWHAGAERTIDGSVMPPR